NSGVAQAVAAPARGIGAREGEPVAEVEAEVLTPVSTTPVARSRVVSLSGIRAGQLVSVELAILSVVLVHRERLSILIPVSVAALMVVGLTIIPRRGHFLYQWLALWLRYRTRRRHRRIIGGGEAERDEVARILLASVARSAEITPVEIEDIEVALISHAGGLTAVLEVVPLEAGGFLEPSQALPPLTALLPAAEIGGPVVSVQVIIQSIPAPNFLGLKDAAAISYTELAGGIVPAARGCWMALQAEHVAEDYTAADLQDSVTRAVTRLQRRLRKAGLRARILNRDEIATEFLTLARVQPRETALTGPSRRRHTLANFAVTEHWRTWSAGPQVQTTFRLLDWPDLSDPDGREMLDRLVSTPTLATTVSIAARWRPATGAATDNVELEVAIRVTLPDAGAVDLATEQIRSVVEGLGGRVERLDGEQVFGVAASLPLGGFLS
ncbi:MAG: type VII secretion protein EccE, partial [Actinomycetota bacterium]|nr:type VII secretion protein EccE [Actinomycetota bacterium]